MSITQCPECGQKVSSDQYVCHNCGYLICSQEENKEPFLCTCPCCKNTVSSDLDVCSHCTHPIKESVQIECDALKEDIKLQVEESKHFDPGASPTKSNAGFVFGLAGISAAGTALGILLGYALRDSVLSFLIVLVVSVWMVLSSLVVLYSAYSGIKDYIDWKKKTTDEYKKYLFAEADGKYKAGIENIQKYGSRHAPPKKFSPTSCINCGCERVVSYNTLRWHIVKCAECGRELVRRRR